MEVTADHKFLYNPSRQCPLSTVQCPHPRENRDEKLAEKNSPRFAFIIEPMKCWLFVVWLRERPMVQTSDFRWIHAVRISTEYGILKLGFCNAVFVIRMVLQLCKLQYGSRLKILILRQYALSTRTGLSCTIYSVQDALKLLSYFLYNDEVAQKSS